VERMTLREAAERSSRSITTLRRYIRSGRLHAEKRYGRFGPEYFVSEQDLADAGLDSEPREESQALVGASAARREPTRAGELVYDRHLFREIVPLTLYQDLQMKHEQLLVQYGMVRAGGLRAIELRSDLEQTRNQLEQAEAAAETARGRHAGELSRLKQQLHAAQLELQGRQLEIDALHEKVRALEMLTRNAVTNETLDRQLKRLEEQAGLVDRLRARLDAPAVRPPGWTSGPDADPQDH
jgi:DNA repair exonuclease SbcCD ATPase subunit